PPPPQHPPLALMSVRPRLVWSRLVSGVVWLFMVLLRVLCLAHEACDGGGCFGEFFGCHRAAYERGLGDAVAEVVVEQLKRDGFERFRCGRYLGEDVDAVLVFVDHAMYATHLPFGAP